MTTRRLIPSLLLSLSLLTQGADEESVQLRLSEVNKIGSELAKSEKLDENARQAIQRINSYLGAQKSTAELSQLLTSWNPLTSGTEDLPEAYLEAVAALQAEITNYQNDLEKGEIDELSNFFAKLKTGLINAQKPEDLDPFLREITSLTNRNSSSSNQELSILRNQLSRCVTIISEWQDYLIAEEAKNPTDCKRALENISRQLGSTPIVPRSHILRLLNPRAEAPRDSPVPDASERASEKTPPGDSTFVTYSEILAAFAQKPDLDLALKQLNLLPTAQNEDREVKRFRNGIEILIAIREQAPRLSTTLFIDQVRKEQGANSELRDSRFTLAIESLVRPKLLEEFPELAEEADLSETTLLDSLEGLFTQRTENREWLEAAEALTFWARIKGIDPRYSFDTGITPTIEALRSLERAELATDAGEIEMAVKEYRSAAEGSQEPVVFRAAIQGLKTLRTQHSDQFQEADSAAKTASALKIAQTLDRLQSVNERRYYSREPQMDGPVKQYLNERLEIEMNKLKSYLIDGTLKLPDTETETKGEETSK